MRVSIDYPDRFHLEAAQGWLALGNCREALLEFKKLSGAYVTCPEYLQVQCRLLIRFGKWRAALGVSQRQIRLTPARPEGWINRAYCLHELNRTVEAVEMLIPAARLFPTHDLITFNLACYFCHLKRYKTALAWVNRTLRLLQPRAAKA